MSALPAKRYNAPPEHICDLLAETIPKLSGVEEHESIDLAKRLIELQDKKRKGVNTNHVSSSFSWLYQLGILTYRRKYLNKGGARLFLSRASGASMAMIVSTMKARPWGFNGKWHSRETNEAIARGENPFPDFVEPPTKEEIEDAKAVVGKKDPEPTKAKTEKPKKKKKRPGEAAKKFVDEWTGVIEGVPVKKKKKKAKTKPEPEAEKPKAKKKCCDDPHVVRSKKTGKRWCKNCGTKYKPKKVK